GAPQPYRAAVRSHPRSGAQRVGVRLALRRARPAARLLREEPSRLLALRVAEPRRPAARARARNRGALGGLARPRHDRPRRPPRERRDTLSPRGRGLPAREAVTPVAAGS